jgi:hypothetical protein
MFIEFASSTDDSPVCGAQGSMTYRPSPSDADNLVKSIIVIVNGDPNPNSS